MSKLEVLCVTMHQKDFSKIKEMNIHSDVVFANQADTTEYKGLEFEGNVAKMITTATRGVGINRNIALMHAYNEICIFADDDVIYNDNYEEIILKEFDSHPDADIFIFHFETDSERKQIKYSKTKKCNRFCRQPWAGFRIAFRLNSIKKANLFFSTLFGGGCIFPSGEDSIWLNDARKRGMNIYVSKETIGRVSFEKSTWFTGIDEKYFFGRGAYLEAAHKRTFLIWMIYYIFRVRSKNMKTSEKIKWMKLGKKGYKTMCDYNSMCESLGENIK